MLYSKQETASKVDKEYEAHQDKNNFNPIMANVSKKNEKLDMKEEKKEKEIRREKKVVTRFKNKKGRSIKVKTRKFNSNTIKLDQLISNFEIEKNQILGQINEDISSKVSQSVID
jgi:hypothetical protein